MRARRFLKSLLPLAIVAAWSVTAFAQLDPLTLIKRVPPTVIIIFDTSLEMLQDGNGNYYDPGFYSTTADPSVMDAFPLINTFTTKTYRRVFANFQYAASPGKYSADSITAVAATWDPSNPVTSNSPNDNAIYFAPTRWKMARLGIANAAAENPTLTRWGVIRLRQNAPSWRSTPGGSGTGASDCDQPVAVADGVQMAFGDVSPCNAGGFYGTYAPKANSPAYTQSSGPPSGTFVLGPSASSGAVATSTAVQTLMARQAGDPGGLIPAGIGGVESSGAQFADRPLTYALTDAKTAIASAIAADAASTQPCRNYVVILVTAGAESGNSAYLTASGVGVTTKAAEFTNVTGTGNRHVPIHVIGVKAAASDATQLQAIATATGGSYHNAASATDVQQWVDYAIQSGYARQTDVDAGKPSEFVAVSPIIGTVDLSNSSPASGGTPFTDTVIHLNGNTSLAIVPQRSNVMVTAGFEMPGFYGRLRAFRVYRPVADTSQSSGYKFVNDGTRLWPDLDGRPSLAGQARTPADPNTRNVYTYVPNSSGIGGSMVAFTAANASTLYPHMGVGSAAAASALIASVRAQPLGAIIGSTPAIMDPPSLDPPPDTDYGHADATSSFAGMHFNRRSIIFVGANDGMMHAIDAKTGYEVWAFIPYNLLPKLQALADGQPVEQFDYFVDSSPKVAEVKISGAWHSLLLFGEGPGGIFYQCFDVSEAGMNVDPSRADLSAVNSLLAQFDAPNESISFKWAFPSYNHFDPSILRSFTLTDGTAGGKITFYGDLGSNATLAEKTVGFSWSDPAVGPLDSTRTKTGVIVGSGYFPPVEDSLPNRGNGAPRAGTALYVINVDTGALIGNDGTVCETQPASAVGCIQVGEVATNGRKNAIQADPTAAGVSGSPVIVKAYVGDLDGRYWRFNYDNTGAVAANLMAEPDQPIYASSALLFVGSNDVYMFFATGSDSLPPGTSGGTGTFKLFGLKDNYPSTGSTTMFEIPLAEVTASGGLVTGERPSTSPTVAGDIVFYTTTTESASTPCSDFTANLYAITYLGVGGYAPYDANGDGRISNAESNSPLVKSVGGRATAPFIVDQHLYFATSGAGGANVQAFGDPEDFNNGVGQVGVRILSWREIR